MELISNLRIVAVVVSAFGIVKPLCAQAGVPASGPLAVIIDHRYANTDAQSLIGLPMGSHKTTVEKNGSLRWSQWSLKRREQDSPIGFSAQMDGDLAIEPFADARDAGHSQSTPLKMRSQTLYRDKYPFIVTKMSGGGVDLEELAFSVDPEQNAEELPTATSGVRAMDVVRLRVRNSQPTERITFQLRLSARSRNLPGHVQGDSLVTRAGELIVWTEGAAGKPASDGLELEYNIALAPGAQKELWLRLPYEFPASRKAELSQLPGEQLLAKAAAQWDGIWARGVQVHYPAQALNDFYQASIAWVLILSEYDAKGDLWLLDGPDVYRQYWGRGEYFQARALEVAGLMSPARQSVEHTFHILRDDGEWDGPPVSGWPAWDNIGGNAGAVWDYYLYTRDKAWLARAYPFLLKSSEWVKAHREETTLEDAGDVPLGAKPVRRMITGSKCRTEPTPPLAPDEKAYWYGLLPWSYGDSGLPEGHSYSHNFLAAYGIRVTAQAARELGKTADAAWLEKEYGDYTAAIRESVERSVKLEKYRIAYLPAQPTRPDAAYSQTFLGIWPTALYSPQDPLVTGLLSKMESEESQGLPTNVAWAGYAGVWPGESMNMSETYLLRDDADKNAAMLLAALNHTYTTDDFKEEILTDVTKERACEGPHSNRRNGQGTGDMPEAWGNANTVNLLRDMLVSERTDAPASAEPHTTLHLLAGLPAEWVAKEGATASVARTPTTLGAAVSLKFRRLSETEMRVEFDPGMQARSHPIETFVHVPLPPGMEVARVVMDGHAVDAASITMAKSGEQAIVNAGRIARRTVFEVTLANAGNAR